MRDPDMVKNDCNLVVWIFLYQIVATILKLLLFIKNSEAHITILFLTFWIYFHDEFSIDNIISTLYLRWKVIL